MTLIQLGRFASRRTLKRSADLGSNRVSSQSNNEKVSTALNKISAFIPAEALGIYVAGLGILAPETTAAKWSIFWACMLLIPIFMLLGYLSHKKKKSTTISMRSFVILCAFALVSFTTYAASIPASPFLSLSPNATAIGGWLAIVLSVLLFRIAELLDLLDYNEIFRS